MFGQTKRRTKFWFRAWVFCDRKKIGDASCRPEMKPMTNTKRELPKRSQPSRFLTSAQAQRTVRFLKSWTLLSKQDDQCVSAMCVFRGSDTNRIFLHGQRCDFVTSSKSSQWAKRLDFVLSSTIRNWSECCVWFCKHIQCKHFQQIAESVSFCVQNVWAHESC